MLVCRVRRAPAQIPFHCVLRRSPMCYRRPLYNFNNFSIIHFVFTTDTKQEDVLLLNIFIFVIKNKKIKKEDKSLEAKTSNYLRTTN